MPTVVGPLRHRAKDLIAEYPGTGGVLIPGGGGWGVHGRARNTCDRKNPEEFDFDHAAVDDHTCLAYAEIHADEKGVIAAGFLTRATALFSLHGINPIERVITDNAFAYRLSIAFKTAVVDLGARPKYIKPHCPRAERQSQTLQPDPRDRVGLPAALHQ